MYVNVHSVALKCCRNRDQARKQNRRKRHKVEVDRNVEAAHRFVDAVHALIGCFAAAKLNLQRSQFSKLIPHIAHLVVLTLLAGRVPNHKQSVCDLFHYQFLH